VHWLVSEIYIARECLFACNAGNPAYMENLGDILQPTTSEIEFDVKHKAVHRIVIVYIATFPSHLHNEIA